MENKLVNNSFIFSLLLIFCSLSFYTCLEPLDITQSDGMGYVRLIIADENSRTIKPPTPSPNRYTVIFFTAGTSDEVLRGDRTNLSASTFYLPFGSYDVEIEGYINNVLLLKGKETGINIAVGAGVDRTVSLNAIIDIGSGSQGTFSWNISFPANVTVATMRIIPLDSSLNQINSQEIPYNFITNPSSRISSVLLDVGYYDVVFELSRGNDYTTIERLEVLHVYENLLSHFPFTFTNEHFSQLPQITVYVTTTEGSNPSTTEGFINLQAALNHTYITDGDHVVTIHNPNLNQDYFIYLNSGNYINKNVTLIANGPANVAVVILLSNNGSMFIIENGGTLTIDNGLVIVGHNTNNASLIRVNGGGKLIMEDVNSWIGENKAVDGGAVSLMGNSNTQIAEFEMKGGTINWNNAERGGGVFVGQHSSFTLTGNSGIGINTADYGGSVYIDGNGTFIMNGGAINQSTANNDGGGVYVGDSAIFIMNDGQISNNEAVNRGGGVFVEEYGDFTKANTGGYIHGNVPYGNKAGNDAMGHAAYHASTPAKTRTNTAIDSESMNSNFPGAAGGWDSSGFNFTVALPSVTVPDNTNSGITLSRSNNDTVNIDITNATAYSNINNSSTHPNIRWLFGTTELTSVSGIYGERLTLSVSTTPSEPYDIIGPQIITVEVWTTPGGVFITHNIEFIVAD
ncbi:MAG: hypothetical protein FWD24_01240 [Treponema sp.]|nr:hypothetical protein [Treponema sp.]